MRLRHVKLETFRNVKILITFTYFQSKTSVSFSFLDQDKEPNFVFCWHWKPIKLYLTIRFHWNQCKYSPGLSFFELSIMRLLLPFVFQSVWLTTTLSESSIPIVSQGELYLNRAALCSGDDVVLEIRLWVCVFCSSKHHFQYWLEASLDHSAY